MLTRKNHICPVEGAGFLETRFRRWLQNPRKIVQPYIKNGMTVLDMGCGPGFFTLDIAQLVGTTGKVIAADLQEGMLQILQNNLQNSGLQSRVILHQCEKHQIGVTTKVDFVLLFFVAHEIPNHPALFKELHSILNPDGQILIVEPPLPCH